MKNNMGKGFTLIELLVVVAIIGILASVIFASLSSARSKAMISAVKQEQNQISKAIQAARINTGKTLQQITSNGWSIGPCYTVGLDLRNISTAHACYVSMLSAFSKVDTASDSMLQNYINGDIRDPWGSPYGWDEQEGDPTQSGGCANDTLTSAGPDGILAAPNSGDNITIQIPFSLYQCGG